MGRGKGFRFVQLHVTPFYLLDWLVSIQINFCSLKNSNMPPVLHLTVLVIEERTKGSQDERAARRGYPTKPHELAAFSLPL